MRGSVNSQMGHLWSQIDGIGISKMDTRAESAHRDLSDSRAVSDRVHSYQYKDEVFRTGRELGDFARGNFGIKDMEQIPGRVVELYIEGKITDGVSRDTLENYISHLAKIEIGLKRVSELAGREYQGFTRDDLVAVREIILELDKNEVVNRAYENPGAIISNLEGREYIVGQLQLNHGLRISEASHIKASQLSTDNVLTFQGKGGYKLTKKLPTDLANSLRSSMVNDKFHVDQNHYRESLRESARIEGQMYTGSHGLRYNFAQETYHEKFEQNLERGMSHEEAHTEALTHTSEEMGHHRPKITERYQG